MLLFDQNLSWQLPRLLTDIYPGSRHFRNIGFNVGGDNRIWNYAKAHDFTIVTKDRDYKDMSEALGHPPKVILIRLGNCSVGTVESLLRERYADIIDLVQDDARGLLELP